MCLSMRFESNPRMAIVAGTFTVARILRILIFISHYALNTCWNTAIRLFRILGFRQDGEFYSHRITKTSGSMKNY